MTGFESSDVSVEAWPKDPVGGMMTGQIAHGVRIVHLETGIAVACDNHRVQHANRAQALAILEALVRWRLAVMSSAKDAQTRPAVQGR